MLFCMFIHMNIQKHIVQIYHSSWQHRTSLYGYTNLHLAIIVFIGIWFISYPCTYVMFAYVYIQARVKLLDVNLLGQSVEKSIFFFFFCGHTCSTRKFPGQGLNLSHSYDRAPAVGIPFFFFFLFGATCAAHESFQSRGWIRATATSLHHSYSNVGSKPRLWPTPQLRATPGP